MEKYLIDVKTLKEDPNGWMVVSLMLALNDIERLVYLRALHAADDSKYKVGSFHSSVASYTASLLMAHVCEAFLVFEQIGKSKPIYNEVIAKDPKLLKAFEETQALVDKSKKDESGQTAYDKMLKRWRALRNTVIFHYNPESGNEIQPALDKVAEHYKTSTSFINKDGPSFHELAYEVVDAIGGKNLGYTFPNKDQEIVNKLVEDAEMLIKKFRVFSHSLILKYLEKYKSET